MSTTPTNSPRWSLFELSATYYQDSDCNDLADPGQELKITAESNGSGQFLTLSSPRWAVSGPAELQALLADFIGRGAGLPLEQVPTAPAFELSVRPLAEMVEPVPAPPLAYESTYLCDACAHDGGLAFDNCTQSGCKGMYLASRPPIGPFMAHEYGFGTPAGPYPVEAIDLSKVEVDQYDRPINGLEEWAQGVEPAPAPEPTLGIDLSTVEFPKAESKFRPWSEDEIVMLRRLYPTTMAKDIAMQLGRGLSSVSVKASDLGLKKGQAKGPRANARDLTPKPMPAKAAKKPANHLPESDDINPGLEAKLLKVVNRLGSMKLFKMDEHEARQALQLLTTNVEQLQWVPGAERLRQRLAGCYSLPVKLEGSRASA